MLSITVQSVIQYKIKNRLRNKIQKILNAILLYNAIVDIVPTYHMLVTESDIAIML